MKTLISLFTLIALTGCSYIQNGPAEAKPLSAAEKAAILKAAPSAPMPTKRATKEPKTNIKEKNIQTSTLAATPKATMAPVVQKKTSAPKVTPAPKAAVNSSVLPSAQFTGYHNGVYYENGKAKNTSQPIYQHPGQVAENKQKGSLFNFGK